MRGGIHCVSFQIEGVGVSGERDRTEQTILEQGVSHLGQQTPWHMELSRHHQDGRSTDGGECVTNDWDETEQRVPPFSCGFRAGTPYRRACAQDARLAALLSEHRSLIDYKPRGFEKNGVFSPGFVDTEFRHPDGFTLHQEVARSHLTAGLEVADGEGSSGAVCAHHRQEEPLKGKRPSVRPAISTSYV